MGHREIAIVTGASSGIGREIARLLNKEENLELWLVARRQERLDELSEELKSEGHDVRVFAYDLLDRNTWKSLQDELTASGQNLRWLVNNAGFGFNGSLLQEEVEHLENMITLNVMALSSLTRRLLPFMKRGSKVVNIASSFAFVPGPFYTVYAATKAYVLSFSIALNTELEEMGITVSAVCPGPVATEFFDSSAAKPPLSFGIEDAKHTAFLSVEQAAQGNAIIITGFMAWMLRIVSAILPRVLLAKLVGKQVKV